MSHCTVMYSVTLALNTASSRHILRVPDRILAAHRDSGCLPSVYKIWWAAAGDSRLSHCYSSPLYHSIPWGNFYYILLLRTSRKTAACPFLFFNKCFSSSSFYYISLTLPAAESQTISIAPAAAHSLWSCCPCGNEQFFLLLFFHVFPSEYCIRSCSCLALMYFSTIVPD